MNLLDSLVEVRNGLIDRKLNAELAAVLMDFGFHLIASVITLQFVGFGEGCLLIPELCLQDVWRLFVDGRHSYGRLVLVCRRSVVVLSCPEMLGSRFDNRWSFKRFPEEGVASICFQARHSCLNSALPRVEVGHATIN